MRKRAGAELRLVRPFQQEIGMKLASVRSAKQRGGLVCRVDQGRRWTKEIEVRSIFEPVLDARQSLIDD